MGSHVLRAVRAIKKEDDMKDPADKVTTNLPLKLTNAEKQAAYSKRKKAAGKVQLSIWVTPGEKAAMVALLASMRSE